MIDIKVETTDGLVRLERQWVSVCGAQTFERAQTFVLPIDEAPGLAQSLLKAIRAHTVSHQRKTFEGEMAGETK